VGALVTRGPPGSNEKLLPVRAGTVFRRIVANPSKKVWTIRATLTMKWNVGGKLFAGIVF